MEEHRDPPPAEFAGDEQAVEDPTRIPSVSGDEEEREAQGEDPTSPERGFEEERQEGER